MVERYQRFAAVSPGDLEIDAGMSRQEVVRDLADGAKAERGGEPEPEMAVPPRAGGLRGADRVVELVEDGLSCPPDGPAAPTKPPGMRRV